MKIEYRKLDFHGAPDAVLIGIAPIGRRLPAEWRDWLVEALGAGCDLWSGLHTFLGDDPVLAAAAARHGHTIRDVRHPPPGLQVGSGAARLVEPLVHPHRRHRLLLDAVLGARERYLPNGR